MAGPTPAGAICTQSRHARDVSTREIRPPLTDVTYSFPPPQQQASWNELEPPRVRGFEFIPSPQQSTEAPLEPRRRAGQIPAVPAIPVQYAAISVKEPATVQPDHASQHESAPPP